MSAAVKVGEERVLTRPTFLFEGIFVNTGITVQVMEITEADGIIVQFLDKEGYPHTLKGIKPEELA